MNAVLQIMTFNRKSFPDPSGEQTDRCRTLLQSLTTSEEGQAQVTLTFKTTSFEDYIATFEASGEALPKYDMVYLVQMLYYVKNPFSVLENSIKSLEGTGRLFLIHVSGHSGYAKVSEPYNLLYNPNLDSFIAIRRLPYYYFK